MSRFRPALAIAKRARFADLGRMKSLLGFAGLFLLFAYPAQAQISPGGGPITAGADDVDAIESERVVIWRGRVDAMQGENRLRTDELRIYYEAARPGSDSAMGNDVERIEADGNVFYVTPTQVARGDRAVWTSASETLVITGDVILTQGMNVLHGSSLTIWVATGRAVMEGAPTEEGRRVRGVFYPDE